MTGPRVDPKRKKPPVVVDTVALKKRQQLDEEEMGDPTSEAARQAAINRMGERQDTLRTLRGTPFTDSSIQPGSIVARKSPTPAPDNRDPELEDMIRRRNAKHRRA